MGRTKIDISKELLEKLYCNQNLSSRSIGKIFNCNWATIINRLKEYKIPLKSSAFARMRYVKKDFEGTEAEKAYTIGFRIGDLNVYRVSENSETIVVRCHTTQKDQIDVINSLFSRFGRVDDKIRPNGHCYTNCFLNNSFKFLFPKDRSAWVWIQESASRFAFIAGYTDAEGNFIINQGRARFKLDSYDKEVLDDIAMWLDDAEIGYKMRLIYKKGDKQKIYNKVGIYHNNLWRLNINRAKDLREFISLISPFMRHRKRISDMDLCYKNIERRIKNGSIK